MTLVRATEARAVAAIRTIAAETGFPPTPTELAEVLGTSERSLQSALIRAKHDGRVGYDGDGCLVVREVAA